MNTKSKFFAGGACAAMSIAFVAGPASAAGNQQGLVNVYAEDTTVQVPIGIAANICDVSVAALAQLNDFSGGDCDALATAIANDNDHGGGGHVRQRGLINLALVDTTVQVPVSVAANICDVSVAALASVRDSGPRTICDAAAAAEANG